MPSASEGNMQFIVVGSGKEWSEDHQEAGLQAVGECSEGQVLRGTLHLESHPWSRHVWLESIPYPVREALLYPGIRLD